MEIDIPDNIFPKITDPNEKLKRVKQEIAILLFEQEEFTLEEAIQFAEDKDKFKLRLVIANIRTLIKQLQDSQKIVIRHENEIDGDGESIDFGSIDWYNTAICRENETRTLFNYICFKFDYQKRLKTIRMKMQIGPGGNQEIRNKIYNLSQKPEHSQFFDKTELSPKHTTIYSKPILEKSYIENADIEDIMPKIQSFWHYFITNDFVAITQIITTNIEMILNDN
ncbi:MAG: hypothetical protein NTY89_11130 [Nostocales cyanobacterium LacPavin_0920_SED1_MAG_38_18]|nr:hypothetical protein [Nostocales cyanobacterium LacPavin_0920_SED1_MAG_38_18]